MTDERQPYHNLRDAFAAAEAEEQANPTPAPLRPHVHCASCFAEVPTTVKDAKGQTKRVEPKTVNQVAWIKQELPGGEGRIVPVDRPVPVCPACYEEVASATRAKQAASRLIVPQLTKPC